MTYRDDVLAFYTMVSKNSLGIPDAWQKTFFTNSHRTSCFARFRLLEVIKPTWLERLFGQRLLRKVYELQAAIKDAQSKIQPIVCKTNVSSILKKKCNGLGRRHK